MITKIKSFCLGIWQELKDFKTLVLFLIVFLVLSSPIWICYGLYFIFKWKWTISVTSAVWLFWLGPFTSFIPLCIAITLGLKKVLFKKK